MATGALALAFSAGVLSIPSPCVLPILPIVLGAAASDHRFGPVALAAGLAVSFVFIGLFVATIGYSVGLNVDLFRNVAAALTIAMGVVLPVPRVQAQLALAGAPLASWSDRRAGAAGQSGFAGQALIGRCSARRGVPALGRRSALLRFLPRKTGISAKSRRLCWRSVSAPPFRSWLPANYRAAPWSAGAHAW
jgi:cytochrome c-type biogenesis protein